MVLKIQSPIQRANAKPIKRIPVNVIAGFLGSGKTTLINRILSQVDSQNIAVLVNDFGALNIDSELIAAQTDRVISLKNGCICCSLQNHLAEELQQLLLNQSHLQRVIIECSGVSEPQGIVHVLRYPTLRERLYLDSVVTLVNPSDFVNLARPQQIIAMAQLEAADLLLLNYNDLCDQQQQTQFCERYAFKHSRIMSCQYAELSLALILDQTINAHLAQISTENPSKQPEQQNPEELFYHTVWETTQPLDAERLKSALLSLTEQVYRSKGFVYLTDAPETCFLLNMVGGRIQFENRGAWSEQHPARTQLVLIGARVDFEADQLRNDSVAQTVLSMLSML